MGTTATGKSADATNVGAMVGATLGLVAFFLAFTFGVAAQQFNNRISLIIDEANSISTTYLRADFLPDANRKEIQAMLRQYVDLRLNYNYGAELTERIGKSDKLQDLLWAQAVAVGKANNSPIAASFVNSMNDTFDFQTKRVAAITYTRLPDSIWGSLFLITLLGMAAIGYQSGIAGKRNWIMWGILATSFAIVITIIADLDRPAEGILKVSKKPLIDLAKKIGQPGENPQEKQVK